MANENKEIGDIVRKCKILLLDIEGTTTSISFVKDKLFPYAEENVKQFLEKQWESDDVKSVITELRKLALEDQEKSLEGCVAIPGEDASKEDQIEGLVNNVKWQMSSDRKTGPLKQLQGLIWKQGYDNGDIKGHVYDDVSTAMEQWHSVDGQKVYIYSSGSVQAQKLLFGQSLAGDLLKYIDGHFDTAVGAKQESASYKAIIEKIGCNADDVLFLTDIVKEAEAARTAGLNVALVSREGNAPLPSEATEAFAVIHSFGQLTASNKRKTDPQNEQPAKVPKTDIKNDVKSVTDVETAKQETISKEPEDESAKMEVEDEPLLVKETTEAKNKAKEDKQGDDTSKMIVEEVVDSETVAEVKSAKTEKETKDDKQKTEKMEIETVDPTIENKKESTEKPNEDIKPVEISQPQKESTSKRVDSDKIETEISVPETTEPENLKSEQKETDKQEQKNAKPDQQVEHGTIETKTETAEKPDVPKENTDINDIKEKATAEETPPVVVTQIEEITDKESLSEMAEIIEDLEPVVEEPIASEDIELQNVGEVLEKECDEILSKVQDVTNLDNIPLKPLLNPIVEESMDTDNIDSNDIVDRILDTEIELEMKNSEEKTKRDEMEVVNSDKITEKTETVDQSVELKLDPIQEESNDVEKTTKSSSIEPKSKENETESEQKIPESSRPETKTGSTPESEKVKDKDDVKLKEESVEIKSHQETEKTSSIDITESKLTETDEKSTESTAEESLINGQATNGETESVNQNGDTSKDEELSSRLSVENGKEVNGSNSDSMDAEKPIDDKVEAEVSDIKVKSVTTEEPRTEPIEQPTEA